MSSLNSSSVNRVRTWLLNAGSDAVIIELATTARSAEEAANSIGVELGSIVKSLVFSIEGDPVMALISGDRRCNTQVLPISLGIDGEAVRANPDQVKRATGFAIGGVAPIAHVQKIPIVIDQDLNRFRSIFAAAGHPHFVFETNFKELIELTGATIESDISIA